MCSGPPSSLAASGSTARSRGVDVLLLAERDAPEFAAVFLSYKTVNFGICALIVALPLALYVVTR